MDYNPNSYVKDTIAAKILGCGVQSLRNRRFLGRPPVYYKQGSMVRYRVQDLIDFMNAGRIDPESRRETSDHIAGQ